MAETRYRLSERARLVIIGVMTVVIIAFVNAQIAGKERIVRDGTTVLLRLAPVDPRSLMQGDYMALRYAIADEIADGARVAGVADGRIVIELAQNGEARFVGIHGGQPLADNRLLLQFRRRGDAVRIASDAFFFEERTGDAYANARFGELRVTTDGEAVLIGLRDENTEPLGRALLR